LNEATLFRALRDLYPADAYALLPQVANGTGSSARRHADAVAMGLWPSRGLLLEGFEIKCSRQDWARELAQPAKADAVARFCDLWWVVVADRAIVHDGELPPDWGLLAWNEKRARLEVVVRARRVDAAPPTRAFVAALLRRLAECSTPAAEVEAAERVGVEKGRAAERDAHAHERARHAALVERVRVFERESGLEILWGWQAPEKLGAAVRAVLQGAAARAEEQLHGLRERAQHVVEVIDAELARVGRRG
jgi:hypothetical protein